MLHHALQPCAPLTFECCALLVSLRSGPGGPLFDRRLVLNRSHTFLAPLAVSKKEWDTCKPLKPYFQRLHRVILVDDDRWEAGGGKHREGADEARNTQPHFIHCTGRWLTQPAH